MAEYKLEILSDGEVIQKTVSDQLQVEISVGPVGVDNGGQPTHQFLTQAAYNALTTKDPNVLYDIIPG